MEEEFKKPTDKLTYLTPVRKILNPMLMKQWESSPAYKDLTGFLEAMNRAVTGRTGINIESTSESVTKIGLIMDRLSGWVDEIPPIDQPQRFGNKAFKEWHSRLCNESEILVQSSLTPEYSEAAQEIKWYLNESFGNATRIDYGTGHEACFLMFLLCYYKLSVLTEKDSVAVVLHIFSKYLNLTRKLQRVYNMEPAGSHGVWSLDDFQFIPFIWGSSQLLEHPNLAPSSFTDKETVEKSRDECLLFDAVFHIFQVKSGPFAEHSNQLWNISGVPGWRKVNQGLLKMYKAEVLGKFPVVQHFLFGSLLRFS